MKNVDSISKLDTSQDSWQKSGKSDEKCKKNLKQIDGHEKFYIGELTIANLREQSGHGEIVFEIMITEF